MKALILAAGKGTRLGDLTRSCPKPMLPIGPHPLLAHTVTWLRSFGIREIAINLHHQPEVITRYFGDGRAYGIALRYSYEAELMGTAGAAKRLQSFLDEPFVVVYGDVFTNLDLARLEDVHNAPHSGTRTLATLALYRVPNPHECGLVETDAAGRVTRFVEKPPPDQVFTDLANAGVMLCHPAILDSVPSETVCDFGRDVLPRLLGMGETIYGIPLLAQEYLFDIGTPANYRRAQQCYAAFASATIAA